MVGTFDMADKYKSKTVHDELILYYYNKVEELKQAIAKAEILYSGDNAKGAIEFIASKIEELKKALEDEKRVAHESEIILRNLRTLEQLQEEVERHKDEPANLVKFFQQLMDDAFENFLRRVNSAIAPHGDSIANAFAEALKSREFHKAFESISDKVKLYVTPEMENRISERRALAEEDPFNALKQQRMPQIEGIEPAQRERLEAFYNATAVVRQNIDNPAFNGLLQVLEILKDDPNKFGEFSSFLDAVSEVRLSSGLTLTQHISERNQDISNVIQAEQEACKTQMKEVSDNYSAQEKLDVMKGVDNSIKSQLSGLRKDPPEILREPKPFGMEARVREAQRQEPLPSYEEEPGMLAPEHGSEEPRMPDSPKPK